MVSKSFDLTGKVAIVTGSTRGIGQVIALALAEAGARIVLSSEDAGACERAAVTLRARGLQVIAQACDLAIDADLAPLTQAAITHYGGLDILVCNAGIPGPVGSSTDLNASQIDAVLQVNLKSTMKLCADAIPYMIRRGGGSIVLIASLASLRGNKTIGLYAISKAAVAQLARNLAVEWGPQNIRANAISPGLIATEFSRELMQNEAFMARRLSMTPLRRVGTAEEIASVALLLSSAAGGFITGQNLVVDGGTLITDGN